MDKEIEQLKKYIQESKNIVFFGGAGVSTESGIPDFRSKDGLYNQHDVQFDAYTPEYLLSHSCLEYNPKVFYEFYRQKLDARNIEPNYAHYALARLEKEGKLSGIVTQNIDGLHQKAGSVKVYEIHGTTLKNYCDRCGKIYPSNYIFDSNEAIPRCSCGGKVRPEVTLYEEGLPQKEVYGAIRALQNADLLIIGGTSLTVYPAASFIYEFEGNHMVVINRDPINVHLKDSDLFIQGSIGEVFKKVFEE